MNETSFGSDSSRDGVAPVGGTPNKKTSVVSMDDSLCNHLITPSFSPAANRAAQNLPVKKAPMRISLPSWRIERERSVDDTEKGQSTSNQLPSEGSWSSNNSPRLNSLTNQNLDENLLTQHKTPITSSDTVLTVSACDVTDIVIPIEPIILTEEGAMSPTLTNNSEITITNEQDGAHT